jgi:hypothetical protein
MHHHACACALLTDGRCCIDHTLQEWQGNAVEQQLLLSCVRNRGSCPWCVEELWHHEPTSAQDRVSLVTALLWPCRCVHHQDTSCMQDTADTLHLWQLQEKPYSCCRSWRLCCRGMPPASPRYDVVSSSPAGTASADRSSRRLGASSTGGTVLGAHEWLSRENSAQTPVGEMQDRNQQQREALGWHGLACPCHRGPDMREMVLQV